MTEMLPASMATTFPSDADHKRLRALKLSALSNDDLWRLHSYRYAFRFVALGQRDRTYACDEKGEWFNANLVARAEAYYRKKLGIPAKAPYAQASGPEAIRSNCRQIPASQLTQAEAEELAPLVTALGAEAKANIAKAEQKWRKGFREPHTKTYAQRPAKEIIAPPAFVHPATAERAQELVDSLDKGKRSAQSEYNRGNP